MTKIEQLVRKFFLESTLKNKTLLELYKMFKETTDEVISFEEFKDAYFLVGSDFTSDDSEIGSSDYGAENISSEKEVYAICLTPAHYYYSKLLRAQMYEEILAVLDDTIPSFTYSNLSLESISDAYLNNKDYTIFRVGTASDDDYNNKTIEYSITAEELQKQINDAIKEIEAAGKNPILPELEDNLGLIRNY